jgi:hypothetical protein
MGSEKQMTAKYNQVQGNADEWLRRAELAVRKGQDELAREALLRRKTFEGNAAAMRPQLEAQRKAMEQLNANIRMLENKLSEAKNKKETLKARAATAKSSKQIQEVSLAGPWVVGMCCGNNGDHSLVSRWPHSWRSVPVLFAASTCMHDQGAHQPFRRSARMTVNVHQWQGP